jgi:hypothetical protein
VYPDEKGKPRTKPGVAVPFKQATARVGLTFASHWVLGDGDIFRLSKILGHSSVIVTEKTYAHLALHAWAGHHRVAFVVPEQGTIYGTTKRATVLAREAMQSVLRAV